MFLPSRAILTNAGYSHSVESEKAFFRTGM
jgi:hypothetical protein